MINIKSFDPSLLKVVKLLNKNDKNLVIYHIKYVPKKSFDPVFDIFDSPCFISNNVNGYIIEESNEDKYLIIFPTIQNKKVLKKYTKLWNEVKNPVKERNGYKPFEYEKGFTRIKFKSDDDLPLGILLNIF